MSGPVLFSVLIRITGFWIALVGLWWFVCGVYVFCCTYGTKPKEGEESSETAGNYFLFALLAFFFGFLVLETADSVANTLY
ncbi:MAG: hypothetical protein AB7O26_07775 [Planctomycetaceae bacterium]